MWLVLSNKVISAFLWRFRFVTLIFHVSQKFYIHKFQFCNLLTEVKLSISHCNIKLLVPKRFAVLLPTYVSLGLSAVQWRQKSQDLCTVCCAVSPPHARSSTPPFSGLSSGQCDCQENHLDIFFQTLKLVDAMNFPLWYWKKI